MKIPSRTALPALCAALFLSACQSGPQLSDTWSSLEYGGRFEVEYEGGLWAQPSGRMGQMAPAKGLPAGSPTGILEAASTKPPQQWVVHLELVQMPREAVNKLLPGAFPFGEEILGGKVAKVEFEETLRAMTEAGDAVSLSSPTIVSNGGEQAWVTMLQQNAFISGFGYMFVPGGVLADPEVDVFHSGIAVGLLPNQSAFTDQAEVQFDLTLTDLLEMDTITAEWPQTFASLSIQVPVFSEQSLRGTVHISADEAAFLPYFVTADNQLMMVFLTAESVGKAQKPL